MTGNNTFDQTIPLFPETSNLQLNGSQLALVRLSNESKLPSSALHSFSNLVLESEDLYPGIDKWFARKVVPGIKDGERIAFILFHQGKAIAESIVKFGADTKICSMRVDPEYQGMGIGPLLFAQIANELDSSVRLVHFTAPECLVEERKGLFDDLGFVLRGMSLTRYRSGQDELVFRAAAPEFVRQTLSLVSKKVAKNYSKGAIPGLLMSIKPEYIEKILSGEKCIEIRRRFSVNNKGSIALLYATKPVGKVMGDALISDVVLDFPDRIWKQFHSFVGVSKADYEQYCVGAEQVSAIVFSQVSKYPHGFDWDCVVESFAGVQTPPQSYLKIPRASLSFWGSLTSPQSKEKKLREAAIGL